MNLNLIFHIALPLCAFIAGASASLIIYRGRLRDLQSQLTTTNALLEVERELKETAAENSAEATAKLTKERKYWSATKAEMDDSIKAMLIKVDELTKEKEQWKGEYISQLNRADRFEAMHKRMTTRHRDPKTGRIVSKARATMLLCDEIKANAVTDVTPNSSHT